MKKSLLVIALAFTTGIISSPPNLNSIKKTAGFFLRPALFIKKDLASAD